MKEFTTSINSWMDKLDRRWKQLPARESSRIVLYSFAVYVAVTLYVLLQVVHQIGSTRQKLEIRHISNPVAEENPTILLNEPKKGEDEGK